MEAFQLLSRGGIQFDKKKFRKDVEMFNKKPNAGDPESNTDSLPQDLDFFKYAEGGQAKRKGGEKQSGSPAKKRRVQSPSGNEDSEASTVLQKQKHRVVTKGDSVPDAVFSFDSLRERYNVPSQILANLSPNGFTTPTAIQSHGIPILLESRDLAAISPTGTGKTLSYALPILSLLRQPAHQSEDVGLGVRALILAPTRELAHQIHNEFLKLAQGRKWRIVLFSKATANTLSDKNVREKTDIIISTPLRLALSLRSGDLEFNNVRHLVLDEADRMLDPEFLEQVQEIVAACSHPKLQKAVFSATLPSSAETAALSMMSNPLRVVVGLKDTPLPLIVQSLTYVADDPSKLPSLLTYFSQPYNPPVIIFTSTQDRATSLCEELVLNEIKNVDCLHAGMTIKEREDSVTRMRNGDTWVLISTEVMARGMDFKGIREIINYDFPTSVQSYIHRIGRTGRAGREGKAVTYFTDDDAPYLKSIATVILQSGQQVPEWLLKLPKPSKMKRKQMGKVKRPAGVNPARKIGRNEAMKKRDMIEGSKRRATKEANIQVDVV